MRYLLITSLILIACSCAYTTAERVTYNSNADGFRVYDPLPLLVVSCSNVQLLSVPDFTRGYAVEFGAILAKNDSTIKITEGLLSEASANLDDTALLSLLQAWGEKALGGVKDLAALGVQVPGTIPGMEGVWKLQFGNTGELVGMNLIQKGGVCPSSGSGAGSGASADPGKAGPQINFPKKG